MISNLHNLERESSYIFLKDMFIILLLYVTDPACWPERKSLASSKVFFLWIGFAPR